MSYIYTNGSPVPAEVEVTKGQDGHLAPNPDPFGVPWVKVKWVDNGQAGGVERMDGHDRGEAMRQLEETSLVDDGAVVRRSSEIRPERVEYAWEGRWPLKSLSLVVGVPARNKSMLMTEAAARITRGQLAGDLLGKPRNVLLASAEDSPSHTIVPRLMAAGADLERVLLMTVAREGLEGDVALPDDIEEIERVIMENDAALFGLDPLSAHLAGEVNSHRDQDVRRALGPLARVADRTGCAAVAVVHLNKAPSTDLFTKVSGSIGITAAARSVLVVGDDPAGEEQGPKRVLVHGKSNVGPYAPSLRFEVESRTIADEGREIATAGLVWRGVAEDVGAREVLGSEPRAREAPVRDAAEDLLRALLADGPVRRSEIKEAATDEDISWRTIATAKKSLGIISEQHQEPGRLGKGPSMWRLPTRCAKPGVQPQDTNNIAHLVPAGQSRDSGPGMQRHMETAHLLPVGQEDPNQGTFTTDRRGCEECGAVTFYRHFDGRMLCPRCQGART